MQHPSGEIYNALRILRRPIMASPKKLVLIKRAMVALQNSAMSIPKDNYNNCPTNFLGQDEPNGLFPGEWRRSNDDITGLVNIKRAVKVIIQEMLVK